MATDDTATRERAPASALPGDFGRLFDAVPVPIMLIDGGRVIVAANMACRDVFGPGVVGSGLALVIRHPDALATIEQAIATGKAGEREFSIAGARARSYLLGVGPVAAGTELAGVAVLSFHDTTATRQAEQMRADFVANVSHELRTPLSSLVGFIETLRGPAAGDGEARERFLAIMAKEADRMSRLVGDLLSLSRIELDEHVAPRDTVDLAAVLEGVVSALEGRARERGIALTTRIPHPLPRVTGDQDQLTQVFQNIVDNAIKYGREKTPVTISVTPARRPPETGATGLSVAVVDHGDGIPRQHMPRLTERFYRVDNARSRALGGTGLGLAIVKHIVSRHRGTLAIDSEEGAGTTVTVNLPVAAADGE